MIPERTRYLRWGLRLEYFTVGWNSLEAIVAIGAGVIAGSIALVGFGLDSVVEVLSGAILFWRLRVELCGAAPEASERAERRALLFVGLSFFVLGAYILYESGKKLWLQEHPKESVVGLGLAIVSLVVMPALALGKQRTAARLGSRALAADAKETAICSYLSFALLLGLGLNAWLGWWWADPVAALAMVPLILREGREAVEEARGAPHD
ncbi:MAG: cation transporter [Candidatus Rokubacteria bacterium]|nr:cation transporter [Candidatus Rokubacteria bacterium]